MEKMYEELFRSMHQFRKLNVGAMMPGITKQEFITISIIQDKGEDGKITISELAAKAKVLPSAISRTLRGLEEKGYIVRNVNQKDRRNTYVELTAKGEETARECKQIMRDYGMAVMSQLNEQDMERLIQYMDNIYDIAEKEIETRKWKEREHE